MLENVRLAAQVALGGDYSLFHFPRRSDAATRVALDGLAAVGLSHKRDTAAGDISHGDKRKLEIAVLLVTKASIVLLDEPMAGVGSGDVAGWWRSSGRCSATRAARFSWSSITSMS